jgi:hypothetical protein
MFAVFLLVGVPPAAAFTFACILAFLARIVMAI